MNAWTRDDLPSEGELADLIRDALDGGIYEGKILLPGSRLRAIIDLLARWMNAHHPKPGHPMGTEAARWRRERDEAQMERADALRERDEALRKKGEAFDRAVRAERERDAAVARAEQAERPASAVSRADVERLVHRYIDGGFDELHASRVKSTTDAFMALLSGSDPAVHVVRESDLPTVSRGEDEHWRDESGKYVVWGTHTLESARANVKIQLRHAAEFEAVARAIEAEQADDPAEEQTDALADILYGDALVTDQMRGVLERVVRAGMLFPDEEATR